MLLHDEIYVCEMVMDANHEQTVYCGVFENDAAIMYGNI